MLASMVFVVVRLLEIVTLIPILGMLAWFVDGYTSSNALTPTSILVLFVVVVLALAWALITLFLYRSHALAARFVSIVDVCIVGALIAGVWYLRDIRLADCSAIQRDPNWTANIGDLVSVTGPRYSLRTDKSCAMLKSSWALAVIACILFVVSSPAAWMAGREVDGKGSSSPQVGSGRRRAYV